MSFTAILHAYYDHIACCCSPGPYAHDVPAAARDLDGIDIPMIDVEAFLAGMLVMLLRTGCFDVMLCVLVPVHVPYCSISRV